MSDEIYVCPQCNSQMEDNEIFGKKQLENFREGRHFTSDPHRMNYDPRHFPNENEIICFGRGCSEYGKKMKKFEYELIRDKHPIDPEILDEYKPKKEEILEDPLTCQYCDDFTAKNKGSLGMHTMKCKREQGIAA